MEYQKVINILEYITNQPSKFRTRNWLEINDESQGTYNVNNDIKFQTSMIRSNLCHYRDAYMHVKATITVPKTAAASAHANNTNKKLIFKKCAPFNNYLSEIDNTQADDAQYFDMVVPMYNLIEYSDFYLKTSESSLQCYRDKPALENNHNIIDFHADNNNSISFKYKQQIMRQTGNDGTKNVERMVPLKYLCNFWRTLKIPLINCQINLQLKLFKNVF